MRIESLSVAYGDRVVYNGFSCEFREGSVTAILGQSGCGKTTLLNEIAFSGRYPLSSCIFQEPRLLPWRTLEKNIMLCLDGTVRERRERSSLYLERVGLLNRAGEYPDRISGGERQRAAIARAFSFPAPVLLMDEPFQSQDTGTKAQLMKLVIGLQEEERRTVIAVTHDVREAIALAERIIVLGGSPTRIVFDAKVDEHTESDVTEVLSCQASTVTDSRA